MGEVYRAHDARLGRDIALKILPPDLAASPEAMRRFEQEARAASALNHPNIVTIYEIDEADGVAWIAMELVEGEDLRTIAIREPLSLRAVLRIATKIADGLAAAHDRGIVHRDLKPDNVMITNDGFVKILDFGLAKQVRTILPDDETIPHTTPGAIFGTVGYMAPEQARGREVDYRSDQFSFGVVLFELLTRMRPFDRESKPETMAAIIREDVPPPSAVNPAITPDLDRIVARCLAKDPRERYASTRDLARDLREIRDGLTSGGSSRFAPLSVRPQSGAPPSRRRWWIGALAAVVLVAFAASALVMWQRRAARAQIATLAVMPFRDLTGTAEGRVLADGISEMVASRLGEVRELRVAGPFDGAPVSDALGDREIARRRGVQALVRGSVQRRGDEVHASAAIIDAARGATLTTIEIRRPASELFALEDALASELVASLGRVLPPRAARTAGVLAPQDQRAYVEAVGLLQNVRDEKSIDRAIALLEKILRNSRDSGPVNTMLARALLFKASLARRPALVEQATVYAARGVALSGNDPRAHATLGRLQLASGRYAEAVQSFRRTLALRAGDADAKLGLAEALSGNGQVAEADRAFREVLRDTPDRHGAHMIYGVFCFDQGRYADAVTHFRRATELAPTLSHTWSNLGAAQQALGRHDEAEAAFRRSLAIQPTAQGWTNLGVLQFSRGRYAESVPSFRSAVDLAPGDPVMWANLGDALRWAPGQREKSLDAYGRAIAAARASLETNANDAYTWSLLATCLAKSGRLSEAQNEIRRALELDPTNRSILYKAAVIAVIRGSHDSAVAWIERAIASGFPASDLAADPELAPIRDLPSFRRALQSGS
jgi:Flp pilus assembly protein TadD/TolB-like protein